MYLNVGEHLSILSFYIANKSKVLFEIGVPLKHSIQFSNGTFYFTKNTHDCISNAWTIYDTINRWFCNDLKDEKSAAVTSFIAFHL